MQRLNAGALVGWKEMMEKEVQCEGFYIYESLGMECDAMNPWNDCLDYNAIINKKRPHQALP